MDLTFSGAGFMGCYYFGVVDCWKKYIPNDRINRVAGASAGSLIAAYYLMDLPLKDCLREIIGLTEDIRSRALGVFDRNHQMVDMLPKLLDRLFPDDAHKQVSGRLFVCMTRLKDMKKVLVSEFETRKDLIDALNCSCFIPVWSGNHVSTYKGVKHIDGGFSDNLPIFDENTIRICCFAGQTDISPYDRVKSELLSSSVLNTPLYFNFANCRRMSKALFPPPASFILDLLERGFHDSKQFILTNDLIQCRTCYSKGNMIRDHPMFQFSKQEVAASGHQHLTISPSVTPALSRVGSQRAGGPLKFSKNKSKPILNATENTSITQKQKEKDEIEKMNEMDTLKGCYSGFIHPDDGFDVLLNDKLKRSCSPDSSLESQDLNNNIAPPTVVINDEEETQVNDIDDNDDNNNNIIDSENRKETPKISVTSKENSKKVVNRPRKKSRAETTEVTTNNATTNNESTTSASSLMARRRSNQVSSGQNNLLVVKDKFTLAPNPLPSCPPSPNLNRHCTECIRMRQEARNDLVEEAIRQEAEKFHNPQPLKEGGIKSKLTSPLRWIRQLGGKNSYRFQQEEAIDQACEN